MPEKANLESAIRQLYVVFGRYHAPLEAVYCRHCVSSMEDELLRTKPLQELTQRELARCSRKAISTWGTVDLFKYVLPRLFELITFDAFNSDPVILFEKPRYGGLDGWSEDERDSLINYCNVLWDYALSWHPLDNSLRSFASIDDCLCSIAQILDNVTPLLERWTSNRNTASTLHLADFAIENASKLREVRRLANSFWDERPAQMQQVVDWFFAQDFALPFEIATQATTPQDLRDDLKRAILRRSLT